MRYLLDTCVISEFTKPQPSPTVIQWLAAQDEFNLTLCTPTIYELKRGIERLEAGKRKTFLQLWLENNVIERFEQRLYNIDADVALCWGEMQSKLERVGKPMPVLGSLIAATAIFHDLTLVTRNIKDFEISGVKLFNPWDIYPPYGGLTYGG
ncbi:MAG: type II toxin-antitoxin system VapC family toxin [Methylophilaceae bacterium]|nr:type II toxin-antitoxin system VapC family toxin [Methylophilaceae bacterium]